MIDSPTPRSVSEHTDLLAMDQGRWRREPVRTIVEAPCTWREFADSEERRGNQGLADEYRQLADGVERYLRMPGGQP